MSTSATADVTYMAPIQDPWPYPWPWVSFPSTVAYSPPSCDHCLCIEPPDGGKTYPRTVPHRKCCHCQRLYAVVGA